MSSVHLWCCTEFCLSPKCTPYILIRGIEIRWVKRPGVGVMSSVVAEIFSQPRRVFSWLCGLAKGPVAICRVFQQTSSQSRSAYFFQAFDIGLCIKCETMWEDIQRHNVTISSDHPKYHYMNWVFGFYQYEYESVDKIWNK